VIFPIILQMHPHANFITEISSLFYIAFDLQAFTKSAALGISTVPVTEPLLPYSIKHHSHAVTIGASEGKCFLAIAKSWTKRAFINSCLDPF
jgi:hypothetical protein